uniref:Uncharacterized protein n=1 Tax=Anguilla anguilla TaxID=7936 RepID=A0A0E9VGS6_ANGAN
MSSLSITRGRSDGSAEGKKKTPLRLNSKLPVESGVVHSVDINNLQDFGKCVLYCTGIRLFA